MAIQNQNLVTVLFSYLYSQISSCFSLSVKAQAHWHWKGKHAHLWLQYLLYYKAVWIKHLKTCQFRYCLPSQHRDRPWITLELPLQQNLPFCQIQWEGTNIHFPSVLLRLSEPEISHSKIKKGWQGLSPPPFPKGQSLPWPDNIIAFLK